MCILICNIMQASKKKTQSVLTSGGLEEKKGDSRQSVSAKKSGQNILRKAKLQLNRCAQVFVANIFI